MTAVITGLVGLVGVLVGVVLSFFLQRRLWQTQEAMKAYSELFAAGNEMLGNWTILASSECAAGEALHLEATLRQEHDPMFRRMVRQCWMLEKDATIRRTIERLEEMYLQNRDAYAHMFQVSPSEELYALLESLQRDIAAKYFHGGAPSGDMGSEDQQER